MVKVFNPPAQIKVPTFDSKSYEKDENEFIKKLKDFVIKRRPVPCKNVGEIVQFQVADGYAQYMIASMKPLELVHIPTGDAYHYPYINRLNAKDIQANLKIDDFWANIKKKGDAEWFKRLKQHNIKPGDIVHDHGRLAKFAVRCELQDDGSLKDIAIVGEVNDYEMPSISIGGDKPTIHYGYHIERAHKGESKIWSNRIEDFPELRGDFSWREKPINEKAMTKLVITPEIKQKHDQYNAVHKLIQEFRCNDMSLEDLKQKINNIK